MSVNYRIRPIKTTDNSRVADIIQTVMTEFGCVGCGYSISDPEVTAMAEHYLPPQAIFYVLEQKGVVTGCGGIGPLEGGEKDVCELRKMYFLPQLRGCGAGSVLLQHCLNAGRQSGYRYCYLETMKSMTAAHKIYRRFGFKDLHKPLGDTGHGSCNSWMGLVL